MADHILVIGATGPTGLAFCSAALKRGYRLTLYVRNPNKVPGDISTNRAVSIIPGTFEDVDGLQQATACGATIFVSFAGPARSSEGTPVTNAMKIIFPLLISRQFKRAMVLGTCSYTAPEDKPALKWKFAVGLIQLAGGAGYEEFRGLGDFVSSQNPAQLNWTLFRVPFLGNGPAAPVKATFIGHGDDGMFLSRESMVNWVLDEMNPNSRWVGKAPVLSN